VRRLALLCAALVFVDTMLYAALTPLLPHFAHEFGLSKAQAGLLVASYATGALLAGLVGGVTATRLGPRRAVLVGLTLMAVASIGFAFAGAFWSLVSARFVQGLASGFTWAGAFAWLLAVAPRERRGQLMGTAMGSATFGAMFGPVVGAAAALAGRDVVFTALAASSVALGAWALRIESAAGELPSVAAVGRALRNRTFLTGMLVMSLGSLLFGVLGVLGPLHLAAAGWSAAGIGAVWLCAAGFESIQAPISGRLSDRHGALRPTRVALLVAIPISLALSAGSRPLFYVPLIVLAAVFYAVFLTTSFALLADGAEEVGLAQGMSFGLMNVAWAAGAVTGPAAGGAIASATGDWIPFVLAAGACAVAFAGLAQRWPRVARRRTAW